jgi:Ca2+/Na+ antiporter
MVNDSDLIQVTTRAKRPTSVWLTQALAIAWFISALATLLMTLLEGARELRPETASAGFFMWGSSYGAIIARAGLVAFLSFITFWGLQRRKKYGRWSAIVLLALFLVMRMFDEEFSRLYRYLIHGGSALQNLPSPYLGYSSEGEMLGSILAMITIIPLIIILILRLALAKSVSVFFEGEALSRGGRA